MPKLPPHIGLASRRRFLPVLATLAALLVAEGITVCILRPHSGVETQKSALSEAQSEPAPSLLSNGDIALYRKAFALEQDGKAEAADIVLAQVNDPLLKGVLLGERYLTSDNEPSFSELALWLSRYGDHAQAGDLYRLARERAPQEADFLTEPRFTATLKGFSNGHDRSVLAGQKHWVSGLMAFRRQDMQSALAHFQVLLAGDAAAALSSDDRAACAFWAYRAAAAANKTADAVRYLNLAADEAPGFYSIIARQVSGERAMEPAPQEAVDTASFMNREPVRRAIALKSIGQDALAEKELRALFPASSRQDRDRLVSLARMLGLPGAQMRMATTGSDANYPLPRWKPTLGYRVEPALLFAIMRQESGFNPNAKSPSGARGVMQLMPATASAMARDARMKPGVEPAVSMTLGQHYLEYLMDTSAISDNLVYLIAAYNAGPGSVAVWQKNLHASEDPLLFIESIPSVQARDYVVRVMGNYWVYSHMLGGDGTTSVAALAANHWPHYERSDKQTLSMLSHMEANGAE